WIMPKNGRTLCFVSWTSTAERFRKSVPEQPESVHPVPEYPDIIVYLERLRPRIQGQVLERVRLGSPFLLRTVDPPLANAEGKRLLDLRRMGKRIVLCLESELFLVLHLMIVGRLHWKEPGTKLPRRVGLAAFDFPLGTLTLT